MGQTRQLEHIEQKGKVEIKRQTWQMGRMEQT